MVSGMNALTVERVRAAKDKTGMKLVSGSWVDPRRDCACAVSQVLMAELGMAPEVLQRYINHGGIIGELLDLPRAYLVGFVEAFDGMPPRSLATDDYHMGHDHGQAVRKELLENEQA
jgi:hypothetical protein